MRMQKRNSLTKNKIKYTHTHTHTHTYIYIYGFKIRFTIGNETKEEIRFNKKKMTLKERLSKEEENSSKRIKKTKKKPS